MLRSLASLVLLLPSLASAQITWSSFDESTLTPAGTGGSASVTVPAGARRTLVASNFMPINLATPGTSQAVTVTFSISSGLAGVASGTRPLGAGLFNSGANASSFVDDAGYFFWVNGTNATPSVELRRRLSTSTSTSLLWPSNGNYVNMGTGNVGTPSGAFANGTVYTLTLKLVSNASTGNLSFGLSNDPGVSLTGDGLSIGRYTNPETTEVKTFDTFGLMFLNSSASDALLTVHSVTLVPVPEPGTFALGLGAAAALLVVLRRRRR